MQNDVCELCGLPNAQMVEVRGGLHHLCDDCLAEIETLSGDRPPANNWGYNRGNPTPIKGTLPDSDQSMADDLRWLID